MRRLRRARLASDGEALARRLEIFRCASRGCGGNLAFALLADLAEAKSESLETDAAYSAPPARPWTR